MRDVATYVILYRIGKTDRQTLGMMHVEKDGERVFTCRTLELPWRENEQRRSCIPSGRYELAHRVSKAYGNHLHILDVPGRSLILIHEGNYLADTLGCILVGEKHIDINGDGFIDVTSSVRTKSRLLEQFEEPAEIFVRPAVVVDEFDPVEYLPPSVEPICLSKWAGGLV